MYDAAFYDMIRAGCQRSASVVVPAFLAALTYRPRTVIDVGGGEGWWAHEFAQHGCEVTLLDAADGLAGSPLPPQRRVEHDLTTSLTGLGRFDLAVCLEVAEHLPPNRAPSLISDLCALAPTVLFSAAIPGQGGVGHINEQWPEYWCALFGLRGYRVSGALRWPLWEDERVEVWYRQNLLVATVLPGSAPELFNGPEAAPLPLVHPVLYNDRRRGR